MTTRKLDTLALIGGIIAVLAIAGQVWYMISTSRQANIFGNTQVILKTISDPEMHADFEMLSSQFPTDTITFKKPDQSIIKKYAEKFPNSPRIQFHAGILLKGEESTAALDRSTSIDPGNALPIYLLASQAVAKNDFTKAIKLVEEGNTRPYMNRYDIPTSLAGKNGLNEIVISTVNTCTQMPVQASLRRLALSLCDYAKVLDGEGQTEKARQFIQSARTSGWKILTVQNPDALDILVSRAIIAKIDKSLIELGNIKGLETTKEEKTRLIYLQAGVKANIDSLMPKLVMTSERFFFSATFVGLLLIEAWIAITMLIIRLVTWLKTRNRPIEVLVENVHSFNTTGLLKFYSLLLALPWLILAIPVYSLIDSIQGENSQSIVVIVGYLTAVPIIVSILLLFIYAIRICKKRRAAETSGDSRIWIKAPTEQKRETARRLSWIHGGAMIFLFGCSLISAGVMKITLDAYPWQVERAMSGISNEESKYVTELIAGKVKIPEKYIKEAENQEKESERKRMEKNKKR